jgi:hypothetical protein
LSLHSFTSFLYQTLFANTRSGPKIIIDHIP